MEHGRSRAWVGALTLVLSSVALAQVPPPQAAPDHPNQVAPAPLAQPVIRATTTQVGPAVRLDFTICNVDTNATYSTTLTPTVPGAVIYNGNPPEDFVSSSYNARGSRLTPGCPGGLQHTDGLKPIDQPITILRPPCGGNVQYRLRTQARRGSSQRFSDPFDFAVTAVVAACPPAPNIPTPPPISLPPAPKF